MDNKRKKRLSNVVFLLNGFLFALGSFGFLEEGKSLLGSIQLLAALSNIAMLIPFKQQNIKPLIIYLIFILNIMIATAVAIDLLKSGKAYIQYVWFLSAIISFIALIIHYNKRKIALKDI